MNRADLDADAIHELLHELATRLAEKDVAATIHVVGGAAIALDWDSRRSTHDIDAVLRPATTVKSVAAEMAEERGLPTTWLSDAVTAFTPPRDRQNAARVHVQIGDVTVVTAPPEHLLAMKMAAFRKTDMEDLRLLLRHLGLTDPESVADLCVDVFGEESVVLPPRDELVWQAGVLLDDSPA